MKVVITVKNGWLAQSKKAQLRRARNGELAGGLLSCPARIT